MLNKITLAMLLILAGSVVVADTIKVNPDAPEEYVVQKGDTLWDISGRFLQQPWLWPEVWRGNPQIANPHLIYPGDVVKLSYLDGQPILMAGKATSGRYVKISPAIHSYEREEAIPTIPIDVIKHFLSRPLVVTEEEMQEWPYIVASYNEHLIASPGNKIYIRGLPEDSDARRYAVYRKGAPYKSPKLEEGEVLGYEALYVGDAIIEKFGDPATGFIAGATREILAGDRLIQEAEDEISSAFIPRPPAQEVDGNIISVVDGVSQIGQYQIVVLDVGAQDGLESGNVLGIYQKGATVKDKIISDLKARQEDKKRLVLEHEEDSAFDRMMSNIVNDIRANKRAFDRSDLAGYLGRPKSAEETLELPEEYAGVLMVFRTFDKLSYALVMEVIAPVHINDKVSNL